MLFHGFRAWASSMGPKEKSDGSVAIYGSLSAAENHNGPWMQMTAWCWSLTSLSVYMHEEGWEKEVGEA